MKNKVSGSCHCGNIQYTIYTDLELDQLPRRKCGCSFCKKHGAVYTSDPKGKLRIRIKDRNKLRLYRFGTRTADVYVCSVCGVEPFFICRMDGKDYAVVNINTSIDPVLSTEKYVKSDFSKETKKERLDRRRKTWIPNVIFEDN